MDYDSFEPRSEHRIQLVLPDGYDVRFDDMGHEWERINIFYEEPRLYWWNRYMLVTAFDIYIVDEDIVTSINPALLLQLRSRYFDQGKQKIEYVLDKYPSV